MILTNYEKTGRYIDIGRNAGCNFVIPGDYGKVSGQHATIYQCVNPFEDDLCYIFEDHSTNGSTINGKRVHNDTEVITPQDKVVLANSYTLDIPEILRLYFTVKTTVKKPLISVEPPKQIPPVPSPHPVNEPQEPKEPQDVEDPIRTHPGSLAQSNFPAVWWWILFVIAMAVAFVVGLMV